VVSWTVPDFCRTVSWAMSLALIVTASGAADERVVQQLSASTALPQSLTFDVPAQSLASALELYGAISGFQVIYDASLAKGRQSADLKGTFAPEIGLRRLLIGTGLSPRYMAADGFMLVPDPIISAAVNTASQRAVTRYYGYIQAGLRQTFCADQRARAGGHRIVLGLWIGSTGVVTRSALLDTTGDRDLDAALDGVMNGMNIGEPPPVGFTQPVVMMVTPDIVRDCRAVPVQRAQR
jgi:hypothetical protein